MEKKYNRKIYYLGNVINSEIRDFNADELIGKKHHGNYLFIGKKNILDLRLLYANVLRSTMKVT